MYTLKGQLYQVQAGVLLGATSTCWIVTLTNVPLSSKMKVYPTGRVHTKNIKETASDGSIKETSQLSGAYGRKCTRFSFFLSNTTFSTDVLQHEYIIYIYIYFIHTFSKLDQKSLMGCYKVSFKGCNLIAFCPCVSQVLFCG